MLSILSAKSAVPWFEIHRMPAFFGTAQSSCTCILCSGQLGLTGGGQGASPLVYVAASGNEVGLWDIQEGQCHQVVTHCLTLCCELNYLHRG